MKLDCLIVCDDVRAEIGNKFSLMGIYLERVVFQRSKGTQEVWPKQLKLGFYLRFLKEPRDDSIVPGTKFNFFYESEGQLSPISSGNIDDPKVLLKLGKFAITFNGIITIKKQERIEFFIEFLDNASKAIQERFSVGTLDIFDVEV